MIDVDKSSTLAVRAHPCSDDVVGAFESLRAASPTRSRHAWLLDSAHRDPRLGRFSFAGADPYAVLRAWGTRIELEVLRPARPGLSPGRVSLEGDPLERASALLPSLAPDAAPGLPFVGGAVGWLGYELAAQLEPVVFHGRDDHGLPDLALLFVDRLLAFDHVAGELVACGLGFGADACAAAERAVDDVCTSLQATPRSERKRRRRAQRAQAPEARPGSASAGGARSEPKASEVTVWQGASAYAKAVDAIREEIDAGNVYQACLTTRFDRELRGDPWAFYRRLRARNPAPFASFLELPEVCIASSSPERFLRLAVDRRTESRPIKGTRPRGADPAEDEAQRLALATSAKDRAENLMIVDLVRNDLGRVCEIGSVAVPELMAIEAYATVFQMVSTITGTLRADRDAFDLVRATFPPGSMTGAPKIAAMGLLDRLEPLRRGIYSGAIGYFDARGGADLSVVIRTAIAHRGRAWVHSGGGIVADSESAAEWREALHKAAPLLAALEEDEP